MSAIGDLWVVGQLFQRPEEDDTSDSADSELLLALLASDRDAVQALLVAGGPVGLREAALLGDPVRVRRLLDAGADPLAHRGWSALHLAAWAGNTGAASVLLDAGVPVNNRAHVGCTPLSAAVACGHGAMVALLLARGADPQARDGADWTPLHQAADAGKLSVVMALLKSGADPNPRVAGCTPLTLAARRGHHGVEALLKQVGGTD